MATESDNVNSGALGTLVAVGAVAFFGIALVVTALVRSEVTQESEKKDIGVNQGYRNLFNEQTAKLNAPAAYTNRATGVLTLPIERAMEVVVADLKKDPNSATPPATASASAAPAASAAAPGESAAPAAAAAPSSSAAVPAPSSAPPPTAAASPATPPKATPSASAPSKSAEKPKPKAPPAQPPAAPAPAPAPAPNGQ